MVLGWSGARVRKVFKEYRWGGTGEGEEGGLRYLGIGERKPSWGNTDEHR